jgi:cell division protein FtsB
MNGRPTAHWLGNTIGILIAVYLCVSLGTTLKRNYDLDKQIAAMQLQISQLQDQRQQLAFQLQYYQTNSYQEREAKSKLGLVVPGENEIILPSPTPTSEVKTEAPKVHKSNFQLWLDFLTGRG